MVDVVAEIKEWWDDICGMPNDRRRTQMLVYAWNWATDPKALRSDREHGLCRRFAKLLMKLLAGRPGWHESESGRLWA